ncbi:hypothetical protein J7E83_17785 [Arthrobacter sp. ISL-48]|uniref:hypothetical protein n=1 Tax=Arthrobacter sp. ISL-48 TaxID=2819110 RepID=UPI001BE7CC7A|nr:hypothetical protein [Arthrobacter sp. ISL-48]MBT2533942.1 hypothetical protein [Arthrobacter sp. ISL-48]
MTIGTQSAANKLRDAMKKGLAQVATTIQRINEGHPAFTLIPRDGPVVGLLVTLDRHWAFDTAGGRSALTDPLSPIDIVSSSQLENLVILKSSTFGGAVIESLSAAGLHMNRAFGNAGDGENPLLIEGERSVGLGP